MKNQHIPLVDVTTLSKTLCPLPILADLKYATADNFIGIPLPGYDPAASHIALLAPRAAHALCQAQNHFIQDGFRILIYDAYRPLQTVRYFTTWFNETPTPQELLRKAIHYPHLEKKDLPQLGYVAANVSRHCFAFSVDIALLDIKTGKEINMGVLFDFFDPLASHRATEKEIGSEAFEARLYLTRIMKQHQFKPYEEEFWHFDFIEQEIKDPLDIPITKALEGVGV